MEALKSAIDAVELVDAHAHNIVAADSDCSFLSCFSVATGEALSRAPHTITFKRSLREIAELYGTECSLDAVEKYRREKGVEWVSSKCLRAGGICGVLIDDGYDMDKSHGLEWHRKFVPFVGRVLRVEILAMKIIDEVRHCRRHHVESVRIQRRVPS
ncbi:hypothetical protein M569_05255 [Genlisea aurea]|uniref:Amidohydrolase-related domain-containing protein n=1 Tax=Genlisea aurea TaxID=192259 RepID=S8E1I2_9LAMI|nr:hypothetical protein M569_05255 [Genlisea aurea]